MARGGTRPGAGRKAGTPNKASAEREAAVKASGLTPLDYMLSIMRDEENPKDMRLDAANKAAPFVHPKLSSVDVNADMEVRADDTIAGLLGRIATQGLRLVPEVENDE